MTTLIVDEGYAYDYLAILQVKLNKGVADSKAFVQCFDHVAEQVGWDLHMQIWGSPELAAMIEANAKTFDCVDRARYGEISAKEVDEANMERYRCKVNLQKKFFPSSNITEQKS